MSTKTGEETSRNTFLFNFILFYQHTKFTAWIYSLMIAERLENKNSGEPAAEGVVRYAS